MSADEIATPGEQLLTAKGYLLLDAATVSDNRSNMEHRSNLSDYIGNCADRRCQKNHVGIKNTLFQVVLIAVDYAKLNSPLQIGSPPTDTDYFTNLTLFAEHTGKRAANKADTDNSKTINQRHTFSQISKA